MSSVLPPEVHSALSQLLTALSSADNVVRTQAEEQLNNDWVPNRRDVLLMGLAEQIQGAEAESVSRLCSQAVFLCLIAFNYLYTSWELRWDLARDVNWHVMGLC